MAHVALVQRISVGLITGSPAALVLAFTGENLAWAQDCRIACRLRTRASSDRRSSGVGLNITNSNS